MELRRGLPWLAFLCVLTLARGQRDFDLADALDDPEPTKKPSSGAHPKPKPPAQPQPGESSHGGGIYPRILPNPHPWPGSSEDGGGNFNNGNDGHNPSRPKPPTGGGTGGAGGGTGGAGGGGSSGGYSSHGGQDPASYDGSQGNTIARIVSPIVSVVLVTLLGAGVSLFKSARRGNCLRASEPENV